MTRTGSSRSPLRSGARTVFWRVRLLGWLLLPLASCGGTSPAATPAPSASVPALKEVLPPPGDVPFDFSWRQHLVASYGEQEFTFQAVVEKSANRLQLLFLAPYGSRALLLEQDDARVASEYFVPQRLPFPPEYILSDVHRVYLRGFADSPLADGTHRALVDGELFVDHWSGGLLKAREVFADEASTIPSVTVRYSPGGARRAPAREVVLDNRAYGYRIEIETEPAD